MMQSMITRYLAMACCVVAACAARGEPPRATVDPEIELVSAVCRLAFVTGFDRVTPDTYPSEMEKRLAPYRDHEAVIFVRERLFHDQTPGASWLAMGANLEIAGDQVVPVWTVGTTGSLPRPWRAKHAIRCADYMGGFWRDSGFDALLKDQRNALVRCETELDLLLSTHVDSAWIEDFFGQPLDACVSVHPAPLSNGRTTLAIIEREGEPVRSAVIVPVFMWRDGAPVFPPVAAPGIEHLYIEACATRYVGDHAEQLLPEATRLFDALSTANKRRPADDPLAMVRRMLADAVCASLTADREGLGAGLDEAHADQDRGTPGVVDLLDLLDDYRQNREQYPAMSDFTARLVRFLGEQADAIDG